MVADSIFFFCFLHTAKLAFGKTIPVATVPTAGISKITAVDFEYAKILRCTIKLLGTAMSSPAVEGSDDALKLSVFVSPALVPLSSPLASAKGPGNMVLFHSAVSSSAPGGVICAFCMYAQISVVYLGSA